MQDIVAIAVASEIQTRRLRTPRAPQNARVAVHIITRTNSQQRESIMESAIRSSLPIPDKHKPGIPATSQQYDEPKKTPPAAAPISSSGGGTTGEDNVVFRNQHDQPISFAEWDAQHFHGRPTPLPRNRITERGMTIALLGHRPDWHNEWQFGLFTRDDPKANKHNKKAWDKAYRESIARWARDADEDGQIGGFTLSMSIHQDAVRAEACLAKAAARPANGKRGGRRAGRGANEQEADQHTQRTPAPSSAHGAVRAQSTKQERQTDSSADQYALPVHLLSIEKTSSP
jgi:hypothetical protein